MKRFAVVLGKMLAAGNALAASPASGTLTDTSGPLSYSAGPFYVSNVTAQATTTPTCTAATPCDDFALTVALPAGWSASHPTDQVRVTVAFPANGTTDFDFYVLDSTGALVTKAASSNEPEVAQFTAASGTYTIRVAPFTVAGDSFTATVELFTPPPPPATPPVAIDPGPAPRFFNYAAPNGLGLSAGEPSLGANWKTGNVMFLAGLETLRVKFDDSTSPAQATWADVSSQFTSAFGIDPIAYVDSKNGRTFVSQLASGLGYGVGCSLSAYSDDDGETWTPSEGCGTPAGADHQTVGGGPYPASSPVKGAGTYPNAVYYCSQAQATAFCARSDDGGTTYGPGVPISNLTQCTAIHGHVKVAPDGTAYVPDRSCGGKAAVIASEDGGITWNIRPVPQSSAGNTDPSVGIGANGTIYVGYQAADGHAHLAVSRDRGLTFPIDADVGSLFGIQNTAFPAVVAGDDNRAAFTFLGSTTPGDFQAAGFTGVWHLYSVHTYDGGQSFSGTDATPNDPVQRGCIWMQGGSNQCRNLLDFTDAQLDARGRVLIGYADGCIGACVNAPPNSYSQLATIARQSGGRGLFAAYDTPEPVKPGAPLISGSRDGNTVHLSWAAPDNGGSAITGYKIYRGASAGSEALVTTVTKTSFDDTVSGATPFYEVTAVNARGESGFSNELQPATAAPAVVYDPCKTPGVLIATDPAGDQTGAPANAGLDLTSLSAAEPYYPDGSSRLVFTLKASTLSPLPPNGSWKIIFTAPDNNQYFVDMNTFDPTAVKYEYGHFTAGTGGVKSNVTDGPIDASSGYTPDGTITLVVDPAKVGGAVAGQTLGGVNAITQLLVGATRGLLEQADTTPSGSYQLVGNFFCRPNNPPVAQLSASPTSGPEPLPVTFNGSGSSDPDNDAIASYTLDFGDGTAPQTQSGAIFTHTYPASGGYAAHLTVTDARGKASQNLAEVVIVANVPGNANTLAGSGYLAGGPKFSLNVKSAPSGSVTWSDDQGGVHFNSTQIDSYSASGKCATVKGRATDSQTKLPLSFTLTGCDNGNPGRGSDTLSLTTGAAYSRSGTLQGGNLKLQ